MLLTVLKFLSVPIRFSAQYVRQIHCPSEMKKALVCLAEGAEEMEFVISVDVLRRGGVDVTVAGVPENKPIKCSRGVVIQPDVSVQDAACSGPYDAIVLPGGLGGAKAFGSSEQVGNLIREQEKQGRIVAAICAAPALALKAHNVGVGKTITSYPSFENDIRSDSRYTYSTDPVVVDGNIITSRGPGTAFCFALKLVEVLAGKEKATEVSKAMLVSA